MGDQTYQSNYRIQVVDSSKNSCEQKLVVPVWLNLQILISQAPCEVLKWSSDIFSQIELLVVDSVVFEFF